MRGGALPPALVCGALGLALALAPPRTWTPSFVALSTTAVVVALTPVPREWLEGVFLAGWLSVIAGAAVVHLPGGLSPRGAFALSLNAGFWSGTEVALTGSRLDLMKALACVLLVLPAAVAISLRAPILVKIVSSWLIAVAVLAATLQVLPVTPGYLPDHLE